MRQGGGFLLAACVALFGGCADTTNFDEKDGGSAKDTGSLVDDAGGFDPAQVESVSVVPADAVIYVDNDTPATQEYRAIGRFKDGSERDITASVRFSLNDGWLGTFTKNTFKSASSYGGKSQVIAHLDDGRTGRTNISVVYRKIFYGKGTSGNEASAFDAAKSSSTGAPQLVYPPDGALIPPNLGSLEIQWLPGSGNDLFEVSLSNDSTDVRIYTPCNPVGKGCAVTPDETMWKGIVTAYRGKEGANVRVRAMAKAAPDKVASSNGHLLSVAQEDVKGGIYYWNATPGVIERYDFGRTQQAATVFYTAQQAGALVCVGCHSLSRNGKRMAVGLDIPGPAGLRVLDVATRDQLSTGAANFMAFSPDGELLITSDGNSMVLVDPTTNTPLDPNPLYPAGTMPDWSPSGELVVFSAPKQVIPLPVGNPGVGGEVSLALLNYDQNKKTWKGPVTLVKSKGETNYYPTFSPDSKWIVFNRSEVTKQSYDVVDAELWIVSANVANQPKARKLDAANLGPNLTNSWPKFAPFEHTYRGRKLMWLTFSSRRDYGLRTQGKGRAQIWMAAIDPQRGELGQDPSYPAFWLPFQNIKTGNHIAQWTAEVVRKPCGIDRTCPDGETCVDGLCEPKQP
jgi:Tol biopolymer transport system component